MTSRSDSTPIPFADISITMPSAPFVLTNGKIQPTTPQNTIDATLGFETAYPSFFQGSTGQLVVVTPPKHYTGPVQLNYLLNDPKYQILGLAFEPVGAGQVGQREFRTVALNRTEISSVMTVTDTLTPADANVTFTYGILVQEVATGYIGLIDPQIHDQP